MNRDELRQRLITTAVVRRHYGVPGAFVRGWYIDCSRVLYDPTAIRAAGRLLRDLTAHLGAGSVIGVERGGVPLARSVAALAIEDGCSMQAASVVVGRTLTLSRKTGYTGPPRAGEHAILVDDIVNSGLTAYRAIHRLESDGVEVLAVACLVRYAKRRPLFLRTWSGPLISVFELDDLSLRRFGTRVL